MAGFWVRHRRGAQELEVRGADLAKRAGSALFAADERIRATVDELGFAEAELGSDAIMPLSEALVAARGHLSDAFRLNRLNHDAFQGTSDEVRARYVRIVELCEQVESVLDEQTSAMADRMARARRAPEVIAEARADIERLRARIQPARETIERLSARYARETLADVAAHPAEAEQLLGFAEHSVGVAERRHEHGRREQGIVALEASVASVRRAAALLDAVETFEVDALRAEVALAALVEESRRNLAVALKEPRSRGVTTAIAELRAAHAALPAAGVNTDPLGHLGRLREGNAALDAAIAAARENASRPIPRVGQVRHAIEAADRLLDIARDAIAGHPGWIGAEALTRLAESERIRVDLGHALGGPAATITVAVEDHRELVIAMARRVAHLASESLQLARRDIDASRTHALRRRQRPREAQAAVS
jgi:exonuclease VII small subunit